MLWQLPPSLGFDPERLGSFLAMLPRDTEAAAALAAEHDERLDGRALTESDMRRPIRYALEVRHPGFRAEGFTELLREHDVALVVADSAGTWPVFTELTAGLVYVRLHGDAELYTSGYTDDALDRWAAKVRGWRAERDVFVYFDNDAKVRAPADARALTARLGDLQAVERC